MSRILHISDLHLGKPLEAQYLDTHRGGMASHDRRAQKDVLRETLASLGEDGTLGSVDAVVVSGDLTNKGESDGFDEFEELAKVITAHVDPDHVVVVPGNHDVPQQHGPGDPERYKEFLRVTRDLRFVTPMLDREDFEPDGKLNGNSLAHAHVLEGDDYVIVPLNSSHFCWGSEPLPDEVFEALLTVPEDELVKATEKMRLFDVARISNAQMTAVMALLKEVDSDFLRAKPDDRVRIAVLHHQLLPVSGREEFKSFESLTNLGAVREFLVSLRAQIVLHGHKHESALFWDHIPDPGALTVPGTRMLVGAAPGDFQQGKRVARLLDIGGRLDARDVKVVDVLSGPRRAAPIRKKAPELAQLWDEPSEQALTKSRAVRGETPSEVYAKVQSLFDASNGEPLHYLVCEIEDPQDASAVPRDYPPPEGIEEVQRWMDDLVEWWQLRDPQFGHGVEFNHGNRIYRRWGDQAQRAADLLSTRAKGDPATTRAAILLLDPHLETSALDGEFPSFVLVQFQLVDEGDGWRLDCTGYFRKQEMRYWWPINVAELADVQAKVAEKVRSKRGNPRAGLLRTIAAYALVAKRLPLVVAVPAIDRAVDQHPEELWEMAYSLIEPEKVNDKNALRRMWTRYLAELEPSDTDELPMSRRGLPTVLRFVKAVDAAQNAAIQALADLVEFYELFETPSGAKKATAPDVARKHLVDLRNQLDTLFGDADEMAGPTDQSTTVAEPS